MKTYSNIYKEKWTQPWPMGSEIYPVVHENPRAFFNSSSPNLLEPLAHGFGDRSLPREDCITNSSQEGEYDRGLSKEKKFGLGGLNIDGPIT